MDVVCQKKTHQILKRFILLLPTLCSHMEEIVTLNLFIYGQSIFITEIFLLNWIHQLTHVILSWWSKWRTFSLFTLELCITPNLKSLRSAFWLVRSFWLGLFNSSWQQWSFISSLSLWRMWKESLVSELSNTQHNNGTINIVWCSKRGIK